MAFWAAIPAIASVASSLFGKKKSGGDTVPAQNLQTSGQSAAEQEISNFIRKFMGQYTPGKEYGGDFVAPTSEFEQTGLGRLRQFLGAPETGELFGATKQNILDTVGGKFADPASSPWIKAMTNLSKMNLADAISTSRRGAGARGSFFTDSAIREEGRITDRSLANMDAIVGDFINQERGRQLQAAPIAAGLEQYENLDLPLQRISASQTQGALPRILEQAELEAQYKDFGRKQTELAGVPAAAQNYFGTRVPQIPSYTNPVVEENNTLGNILQAISRLNWGGFGGAQGKGPAGGGAGPRQAPTIWDRLSGLFQ